MKKKTNIHFSVRWFVLFVLLFSVLSHVNAQETNSQLDDAYALLEIGDLVGAQAGFQSILDAALAAGDRKLEADAQIGLGRVLYSQEAYRDARLIFEKALLAYRAVPNTKGGTALAAFYIARCHYFEGSFDNARVFARQAETDARAANDPAVEAPILRDLGSLFTDLGDYRVGADLLTRAETQFFTLLDKSNQAATLQLLGNARFRLWEMDVALDKYNSAALLYAELGDVIGQGTAMFSTGRVYHHRGQLQEAQLAYEQALDLYRQGAINSVDEGRTLAALGDVYHQLGFSNAQSTLDAAQDIIATNGSAEDRAQLSLYQAEVLLSIGDYQQALNLFNSVRDQETPIAQEAHAHFGIARIFSARPELSPTGQFRDAINNYDFAIQRYRSQLRDNWNTQRVFVSQAWDYLRREDPQFDGTRLLFEALNIASSSNDPRSEAGVQAELGRLYATTLEDLDFRTSIRYYEDAVETLSRINDPILTGQIYIELGDVYVLDAKLEDAREAYDLARSNFQTFGDPVLTALALSKLGNVYVIQGNNLAAYTHYNEALDTVAQTNGILRNENTVNQIEGESNQGLGLVYMNVELYAQAEQSINDAIDVFNRTNNPSIALAYSARGDYFFSQGDYTQARNNYRLGNDTALTNADLRGQAYNLLGTANVFSRSDLGTPLEMRQTFDDAIRLFQEVGDLRGLQRAYITLGDVDLNLGDLTAANAQYSTAYEVARQGQDIRGQALAQLKMAEIHVRKAEFTPAVRAYEEAVEQFVLLGDANAQGLVFELLGDLYLSRSQYEPARDYYTQMQSAYQLVGDKAREARAIMKLAQLAHVRAQYAPALTIFDQALTTLQEYGSGDLDNDTFRDVTEAEILTARGLAYIDLDLFAAAETDLNIALDLYSASNDDMGEGRARSAQGELFLATSQPELALPLFTEARDIAIRLGDTRGQALALHGLGRVYTYDDDAANFAEENQAYQNSLALFRNTAPDPALARVVLTSIAESALLRNDLDEANVYFSQAQTEARQAVDKVGEGYALLNLARLSIRQHQFNNALNQYNNAIPLFRQAKDTIGEGEARQQLADLYIRQVRYSDALNEYEQMVRIFTDSGDNIRLAETYSLIGDVYRQQSRYALALTQHLAALDLLQTVEESSEPAVELLIQSVEARVYRHLADVQILLAEHDNATENLQLALDRVLTTGDQMEQGVILTLQGNIAYIQGDYIGALDRYEQARLLFEQFGTAISMGRLQLDIGDAQFEIVKQRGDDWRNASTRSNLGYQAALRIADQTNDERLEIQARTRLGELRLNLQQYGEALDLLMTALDRAVESQSTNDEIRIRVSLGLVYEAQENLPKAIEQYQQAIELIEDIHSDIRLEGSQINFAAQHIIPYRRLVAYFAESDPRLAFEYAERSRSRTFLLQVGSEQLDLGSNVDADLLAQWQTLRADLSSLKEAATTLRAEYIATPSDQRGEITNRLTDTDRRITQAQSQLEPLEERIRVQNSAYSELMQVTFTSVDTLQTILPAGTTMLSYYLIPEGAGLPGQVIVFVISQDQFELETLSVDPDTIRNLYREFDGYINGCQINASVADCSADTEAGSRFYADLVAEIEPLIADAASLVVVPHSTLNYLPFNIFYDGEAYLDDRFNISYVPSASFYQMLIEKPISNRGTQSLIMGNALGIPAEGLGNLLAVEGEVNEIASLLETSPLLNQEATETRFYTQTLNNLSLIHIAAHAVFKNTNPLSTYIALSDDFDNDGHLEVREIYSLPLRDSSPLVVLSACDTLKGVPSEGDEFQGLTRAFLISGARTVVASLWAVDDAATAALMTQFYSNLSSGMTASEALRAAQHFLRTETEWKAPYYWSPFLLVGLPE